ncbi:MAG: IS4 family transposase, partial [Clostridia bacterium]|nr:IS4 family transposase [Clostridia bacterium]
MENIKNIVGNFCKKIYDKINNVKFAEVSKMRKEDFSRQRKVGFGNTILIILNKTGKGLNAAIRTFRETIQKENENYSKQAFSKGRMRIKWEALREIFHDTVKEFYAEFDWKKYKGYRILAVDGTKINLPYHAESKEEFGIQPGTGETIQALASCLYDTLNGIIVDACIEPVNSNERELAEEHLKRLSEIKSDRELITFDRGYPSAELLTFLENTPFKYLIRADQTFVRGIMKKVNSDDCIVCHTFVKSKISVRLRVLQIHLKDSENNDIIEILLTNIFEDDFIPEEFKELYHLRWGIETKYDDIKNKLEIESFSGTSPLAVRQDFFATMFLNNLASMMIAENADEID